VPLPFELADHDEGKHHTVLGEPGDGPGIGQQYGGVEYERTNCRIRRFPGGGGRTSDAG